MVGLKTNLCAETGENKLEKKNASAHTHTQSPPRYKTSSSLSVKSIAVEVRAGRLIGAFELGVAPESSWALWNSVEGTVVGEKKRPIIDPEVVPLSSLRLPDA